MGSGCSRIHVRVPSVLHFVSAAARSRRLENELEKTKEESINEVKLLLLVIFDIENVTSFFFQNCLKHSCTKLARSYLTIQIMN